MHTRGASSDSTLDADELPALARAAGLSGVSVCEHDKMWERVRQQAYRSAHAGFFMSFGMEVSTDLGHMIAIGLAEYVSGIRRAERLREELDRVGGFMIVAHPFRHVFDPVTAMRAGARPFELTPEQAAALPVFKLAHAIEVANGSNTPRENEFAQRVALASGLPGTGGSDAHSNTGIGYFATGFERALTTPAQLLEELRAGRFEAVHRTPAGRVVRFEAGSHAATRTDPPPG